MWNYTGSKWTKCLWYFTSALFFADSKAAPQTKIQVLPMWCHGILTCCLTAHTRCIFACCLRQLASSQYACHIVLRITLSLSSLTSCKRARVPEITNMYTNIISHSRPHKRSHLKSFHTSSIFPHLCKQCVNTFSHGTQKKSPFYLRLFFIKSNKMQT